MLNNLNPDVRIQAIKHLNVTSEHITKALNDSDLEVKVQTARRYSNYI